MDLKDSTLFHFCYNIQHFILLVTRGCAPEKGMNHEDNDCKTTEVAGRKVFFCHCTEDYCNTSNICSSPNLILLFLSIASLIFVRLTQHMYFTPVSAMTQIIIGFRLIQFFCTYIYIFLLSTCHLFAVNEPVTRKIVFLLQLRNCTIQGLYYMLIL